jgi:hypothetical protein
MLAVVVGDAVKPVAWASALVMQSEKDEDWEMA